MSPEKLMPLALFAVVWLLATYEFVRGIRCGEMVEYLRSGGSRTCAYTVEPVSFSLLLLLYGAVAIGTPALLYHVLTGRLAG